MPFEHDLSKVRRSVELLGKVVAACSAPEAAYAELRRLTARLELIIDVLAEDGAALGEAAARDDMGQELSTRAADGMLRLSRRLRDGVLLDGEGHEPSYYRALARSDLSSRELLSIAASPAPLQTYNVLALARGTPAVFGLKAYGIDMESVLALKRILLPWVKALAKSNAKYQILVEVLASLLEQIDDKLEQGAKKGIGEETPGGATEKCYADVFLLGLEGATGGGGAGSDWTLKFTFDGRPLAEPITSAKASGRLVEPKQLWKDMPLANCGQVNQFILTFDATESDTTDPDDVGAAMPQTFRSMCPGYVQHDIVLTVREKIRGITFAVEESPTTYTQLTATVLAVFKCGEGVRQTY